MIDLNDMVKRSQTATEGGRKFDGDKLEYGLLPAFALMATVDVLTIGAQKYERDNWIHVPDAKRRYFDALQRHLWAWKMGESNDRETGRHHLAHAMCCLMFLYEHDTVYSDAYKAVAEQAAKNAFEDIQKGLDESAKNVYETSQGLKPLNSMFGFDVKAEDLDKHE